MVDLEGKSVVIVGGAGGIGFELSKELLAAGVEKLIVLDLTDPKATHQQLKSLFPLKKIIFLNINVKDKSNVENVFKEVTEGIGTIDIVINAAAVLNDKTVENTIEVNVLGLIYCTQVATKHMSVENGGQGGVIVNFSSVAGLDPLFSIPVYSASKYAVTGYTAALADERLEKKFGIKFVTICPGSTDTSLLHNMRSLLMSEDLFEATEEYASTKGSQSPNECAKSFIAAIQQAQNGSVFILDNKKCTPVKLNKYLD